MTKHIEISRIVFQIEHHFFAKYNYVCFTIFQALDWSGKPAAAATWL
jgi:hypothetical protein